MTLIIMLSNGKSLILWSLVLLAIVTRTSQACSVITDEGIDVTSEHYREDKEAFSKIRDIDGYVLCEGNYACQNYTISNCAAVRRSGKEACYLTTITEITHILECTDTHSCHRSVVDFTEGETHRQSMSCEGEGACDVAVIKAPDIHLECFGRKACRKVDATIDTVHCTHGDKYYDACTGYAGLFAKSCVMCGWHGCDSHVNICRYKNIEDDRYVACHPEQAFGPSCPRK